MMATIMKGTKYEIAYRKHIKSFTDAPIIPGKSWYYGFMKRNSNKLTTKRAKIQDNKRNTYCTFENFERMYENVYDAMIECDVAIKLHEKVMLDRDGKEVENIHDMFGLPTNYILTQPERLFFMDETGCNTNQKADNLVGGEQYIVGKNASHAACVGVTTDLHFTVCCFTCGLGSPVMCAVMFKSNRNGTDIPVGWKTGINCTTIDLTMALPSEAIAEQIQGCNDIQTYAGCDIAMGGGPLCCYDNKMIPCFYASTPNASITAEILVRMLDTMDSAIQFDRSDGTCPCLIVDGYPSRCSEEFLSYVNIQRKWKVCVGVPYGTHIWQVADSSELNGAFKIALVKAKREYRQTSQGGVFDNFSPTDIIPLLNTAWDASFAKAENGKKAICERGWGPLNYNCLLHPNLQKRGTDTSTSTGSDTSTLTNEPIYDVDAFRMSRDPNQPRVTRLEFNSDLSMHTVMDKMIGDFVKMKE
jgi:hypothetical protein